MVERRAGSGLHPQVASPFDPRLRYNLYACLTVLPRHQERHIRQAEQVLQLVRDGK